jgi:hypothetical protein
LINALDIKLIILEPEDQLVLTMDTPKISCSYILWVYRGNSLRVMGCYSKLFPHTASLKSIHFKETYSMVLAFDHFKAYSTSSTPRSLSVSPPKPEPHVVGRNREYSIA